MEDLLPFMHISQLPSLQQEHCPSLQQSPHLPDLQHSHFSQQGIFIAVLLEVVPCVLAQAVMNTITTNGNSFLNIRYSLNRLMILVKNEINLFWEVALVLWEYVPVNYKPVQGAVSWQATKAVPLIV
jgi:hypothetical protein